MRSFTPILLSVMLLMTLCGCAVAKHDVGKQSKQPSILDKLLLPAEVASRVEAAERDLPGDEWKELPKIGRHNRTRFDREAALANELLDKVKHEISGMSVADLVASLKTFPYPGYGHFAGVQGLVYEGGNEIIIAQLKRRPGSQLAQLKSLRQDRHQIWNGPAGPPLSIGELVRYELLKERLE